MRERLEPLLGPSARAIWILTFHAACGRILRREAERLGYRSNFTIYDQADQVRLVKACLEELERDPKRFAPRGIHAQISNAKNQLIGPDEYRERVASLLRPDRRRASTSCTSGACFASNAVDFDDLLMLTVEVLRALPGGARALAEGVPLRARRRVPGHEPRPVRLLQLLAEKAPERLRRRRSGPVSRRRDAGHDGRRLDEADRAGSRRRRGAVLLRQRRLRPGRVRGVQRVVGASGDRDHDRGGRRLVSTPEHVHFAGFKAGRTPQLHMTYLMWKRGSASASASRGRTRTVGSDSSPGRRCA